jgi:hypothetical protein
MLRCLTTSALRRRVPQPSFLANRHCSLAHPPTMAYRSGMVDARPTGTAPAEDTLSRRQAARVTRPALLLAMELFIVFVGVYAASAFGDYEKRREAGARRDQLQVALVQEISDIISNTGRVARVLPPMLAGFDSAVAAGARPPLDPWLEPVRVDTHMWEATLQSGALDLFDVATVYRLSQFYNELNAGFAQLAQLRSLSETVLLPNLDRGSDEFYEPGTGRLRSKYRWHREGLGRLSMLAASITESGARLVADLSE